MSANNFFERKGPFPLKVIAKAIGYTDNFSKIKDFEVKGFESLDNAEKSDMTFLNSSKYKNLSLKTKAGVCITSPNLSKFLPENCIKLNVKNVLFAVTKASKMFYPDADIDTLDQSLLKSNNLKNLYSKIRSKLLWITFITTCHNRCVLKRSSQIILKYSIVIVTHPVNGLVI